VQQAVHVARDVVVLVSILTHPSGRVQPHTPSVFDVMRQVSILTHPSGRVQHEPEYKYHLTIEFQSSPTRQGECNPLSSEERKGLYVSYHMREPMRNILWEA